MMCSARSLGSASSSSCSARSSSGVAPRGREPAIGNVTTRPSVTLTSVSGLEPTTAKSAPVGVLQLQVVHVRARVDRAQHPVDVERVGRAVEVEALREDDLEHLAVADRLLADARPRPRTPRGSSGTRARARRRPRAPRRAGSAGCSSAACIASSRATASACASSTRSSVSSKLIAFATSQTEPSRWSTTARSVARQQRQLGDAELVGRLRGQRRLPVPHDVPAERADEPAGQRRQARRPRACAARRASRASTSSGVARRSGTPTGTSPAQTAAPSRDGQRRARAHADERVPRPVPSDSADSRMNVPGRPAASVRYRPTGVTSSASSRRTTGMTRRSRGQRAELVERRPGRAPGDLGRGDVPGADGRGRAHRGSSGLGAGGSPTTAGSGPPASKQVRVPVWQAAPTWSTSTSSASPSQSRLTDLHVLGVAGGVALAPVLLARPAPERHPARGQRAVQRLVVHPADHEHLARCRAAARSRRRGRASSRLRRVGDGGIEGGGGGAGRTRTDPATRAARGDGSASAPVRQRVWDTQAACIAA